MSWCGDQNLSLTNMITRVPIIKFFSKNGLQLLEFNSEPMSHPIFSKTASVTSSFLEVTLHLIWPSRGHLPSQRPFHSKTTFHHFKVFNFLRSFPFQKSPTPSQKLKTSFYRDLLLSLRSSFHSTLIACNVPFRADSYGRGRFSGMQFQPISTNNHNYFNKSNTCRSCSYRIP